MFNEIAAEQPDLQLPTEEELGSTYRGKGGVMSIASDVGFRMPSVWLAEGHCRVAPVYLYRFDYSTPIMPAMHHHLIVAYASYLAAIVRQDEGRASVHMAEYNAIMGNMRDDLNQSTSRRIRYRRGYDYATWT